MSLRRGERQSHDYPDDNIIILIIVTIIITTIVAMIKLTIILVLGLSTRSIFPPQTGMRSLRDSVFQTTRSSSSPLSSSLGTSQFLILKQLNCLFLMFFNAMITFLMKVITWFQNRRARLKRDLEELRKDVASKGGRLSS